MYNLQGQWKFQKISEVNMKWSNQKWSERKESQRGRDQRQECLAVIHMDP